MYRWLLWSSSGYLLVGIQGVQYKLHKYMIISSKVFVHWFGWMSYYKSITNSFKTSVYCAHSCGLMGGLRPNTSQNNSHILCKGFWVFCPASLFYGNKPAFWDYLSAPSSESGANLREGGLSRGREDGRTSSPETLVSCHKIMTPSKTPKAFGQPWRKPPITYSHSLPYLKESLKRFYSTFITGHSPKSVNKNLEGFFTHFM